MDESPDYGITAAHYENGKITRVLLWRVTADIGLSESQDVECQCVIDLLTAQPPAIIYTYDSDPPYPKGARVEVRSRNNQHYLCTAQDGEEGDNLGWLMKY